MGEMAHLGKEVPALIEKGGFKPLLVGPCPGLAALGSNMTISPKIDK